MMRRSFLELDVFADAPGRGNPLGVVFDAEGLEAGTMQHIAHWLNLSETIFLLPPTQGGADYRVRIFTPRRELPFAGHPSVGAAFAVLASGRVAARGPLVQECEAGLLPVRVEGEGADVRAHVRSPRAVECPGEPSAVLAALGSRERGSVPPVLMDNGPRWWCVDLRDEATVRGLQPDQDALARACAATSAIGAAVYALCAGRDGYALVVRAFVPGDGIPEDPVTGSANATIATWLHRQGALPSRRYVASQGREVGRDGRVEVEVDDTGEVWIGGRTQQVVEGYINW